MRMGNNNTITKTVALLVKNLSVRNRDIISRRFGLKTGKKETLESIGKGYGITRERVRQIEEFSLKQLSKAVAGNSEVAKYVSLSKDMLSGNGGVMKENELFQAFSGNDRASVVNASLVFLLTLTSEPIRFSENDFLHSFWAIDQDGAESFKKNIASLVSALDKNKKPIPSSDLSSFAERNGVAHLKDMAVALSISKELSKNVFGEVGLINWPEIQPKGVRDKAYLVLKKGSQPKHFTDISKLINATGFSTRKANVQTVHNELIKDPRFVLVGRGLYGLSEWGYKAGTIKEVLVDILKDNARPLPKAELVAKVLSARVVKENTILLNLQDSKVFLKKDDGTYALRKA